MMGTTVVQGDLLDQDVDVIVIAGDSKPASEHDANSHDRTRLGVGKSHVDPNS